MPAGEATNALAADLGRAVRGTVRFDAGTRAMWSADASNYRRVPIGVVTPRDAEDVEAAVAVCGAHEVPLLPVGARTSIAGQAVNSAVVLDFSRMNAIVELDPEAQTARVQPGVVLDALRDAARPHGLTFGPDPSTHNRCTLGGMIGNNACGSHSVAWGKTVDNVHALDVLTYRGERLAGRPGHARDRPRSATPSPRWSTGAGLPCARRSPTSPAASRATTSTSSSRRTGFDLARALVGTEGTCATIVEATVALVSAPPARALAILGFPDAYIAADHVMPVRALGPLTIEGMDAGLIAALRASRPRETTSRMLPEGAGWLYVETGGETRAEAEAAAHAVVAAVPGATSLVVADPAAMRALWRIREDGAGIVTRSPDGDEAWPGWEDAAVPPERFGAYLREFDALLRRHHRRGAYYGHFGDGCLHIRIDFDLLTKKGIADFRAFMEDAADLAVAHGGSLSGEHGDGAARAELLPRMYPPEIIDAFAAFKGIWDPDDQMNPGRVVRPARLDEDLRVFVGLPTLRDAPVLAFADDRGSFTRATRRCLGVGKCVTETGGVMCPSYRATGEEQHSTRGRARLLFEMANGQVITGGWRSPEVEEALDLCLSCKGCKRDCPVGVDMAAYKTEYLAQRYRWRLRPLSHYSMGALPMWLHLVAQAAPTVDRRAERRCPRPAGTAGEAPGRGGAGARDPGGGPGTRACRARRGTACCRGRAGIAAGCHRCRPGRSRVTPLQSDVPPRVLLWTDTFSSSFDPAVVRAAVAVLERLGYAVEVPPRTVCCGLTWTTTGQVATARRVLRRSLRTIEPWLLHGVPVVGLEPSCTAALRADAAELLPGHPLVAPLEKGVRTFAELLAEHTDDLRAAVVAPAGRALVQIHCHQHAELGADADRAVMAALGADAEVLDSGCCGLAGNFGFEKGHYDVSMACAERVLLPAVRAADPDVAVLADGFSCRTQLRQADTREPIHLAQLAARALGLEGESGNPAR